MSKEADRLNEVLLEMKANLDKPIIHRAHDAILDLLRLLESFVDDEIYDSTKGIDRK